MKILYKQVVNENDSTLAHFGAQNSYLKQLELKHDHVHAKPHHHTGFEIHLVIRGCQVYDVQGKTYTLENGCFLIISPNVTHNVTFSAEHTQKYAITFQKSIDHCPACCFGTLDERIVNNLAFVTSEAAKGREISATLIENCLLEMLVWAFRAMGIKENEQHGPSDKNAVVSLAKQYIEDNIETAPTVSDIAKLCCLSTKQLTRLFVQFEGISPGEYILKKRIEAIEKLLVDKSISLKQISESMCFNNEYYFNAFFKKHAGMPPGEYRKAVGK